MANNFCRFLSNGFRIETNGQGLVYKPCCWFAGSIDLINNPDFLKEKQQISEINDWVPECQSCKIIEESGITNPPRLRSFKEIPDGSIPDNVPAWVELSIDTTCNAACLMCGPHHSTTWVKQEIKYNIKTAEQVPDAIDPLVWFDLIKRNWPLDYVNSISFLGGEPFKSEIPLKFLQELKKVKDLKDVSIHFQTNGSIQPSKSLILLMEECRQIKYNISLDGYGPHLEYIRYPLKWNKIVSTLEYVKSLQLPNLNFTILNTINPLNAFYYNQVEQWASDFFNGSTTFTMKPNRCVGNLDLALTPHALRQEIVNKYGLDHNVSKMFSNLDHWPSIDKLIEFLDFWDRNRKTSWRETFPEMVKYYE